MSWSVSGLRNGVPVSSSCAVVACLAHTPPRQSAISSVRTAPRVRALRVLLGAVEQPELVLERVAVLVGDDVLLRERPTAGAELVLEHLEEAGVDVDLLVQRAVERPDLVARGAARRLGAAVVEDRLGRLPLLAVARQLARPVGLHRVHRADDPAVGVPVGVGPGLALLKRCGVLVAGCRHLAGVEAARPTRGVAAPAEDPVEEQVRIRMMMPPMPPPTTMPPGAPPPPPPERTCEVSRVTLSLKLIRGLRRQVRGPRGARRHLD